MKICGWNKTTLLDYPGHVAATLFTGGCNFRCPFCHNAELVLCSGEQEIREEEIFAFLRRRKGVTEGVCITGGEPTLQPGLKEFIRRVKELGFLVKLDTNGYRPETLWELMEEGLPDYVAMDVKASRGNYAIAAGLAGLDMAAIEMSMGIIRSSGIPYEFRTTVVKGIHTEADIEDIGRWLSGCRAYYLQAYRDDGNVLQPGFETFSSEEMYSFAEIARKYIDNVSLRGIE